MDKKQRDIELAREVGFNTEHVEWQGASLHDLIQPGFSFLVGASLPFSIANRRAKGESFGSMLAHAARRHAGGINQRRCSPPP